MACSVIVRKGVTFCIIRPVRRVLTKHNPFIPNLSDFRPPAAFFPIWGSFASWCHNRGPRRRGSGQCCRWTCLRICFTTFFPCGEDHGIRILFRGHIICARLHAINLHREMSWFSRDAVTNPHCIAAIDLRLKQISHIDMVLLVTVAIGARLFTTISLRRVPLTLEYNIFFETITKFKQFATRQFATKQPSLTGVVGFVSTCTAIGAYRFSINRVWIPISILLCWFGSRP